MDEFGAYVMNADFKPKLKKTDKKHHHAHHIQHTFVHLDPHADPHADPHYIHDIHHDGNVHDFHGKIVDEKVDMWGRRFFGHVDEITPEQVGRTTCRLTAIIVILFSVRLLYRKVTRQINISY